MEQEEIGTIMRVYVIPRNMIVDNERDNYEFVCDYLWRGSS